MNKNTKVVLYLLGTLVFMGGLAYASVPLYRAFCSATGFNGTARKAEAAPVAAVDKTMRVRFDANARDIPWSFKPDVPYFDTQVGRTQKVSFTVTNNGKVPITGRATYNILPDTMGPYFMKLQCFCFENQTLQPGESKQFPVVYYLDPQLMTDPDTKTVPEVTLSYTFFESRDDATEAKK